MSRAYLETLADLPWSTFSDSRQKHNQPAPSLRPSSSTTANAAGAGFSAVISHSHHSTVAASSVSHGSRHCVNKVALQQLAVHEALFSLLLLFVQNI